MMELLMMTVAFGLALYLTRKDIFVFHFKLGIKVLGLNLELKAKEKSRPPHNKDNSYLKK